MSTSPTARSLHRHRTSGRTHSLAAVTFNRWSLPRRCQPSLSLPGCLTACDWLSTIQHSDGAGASVRFATHSAVLPCAGGLLHSPDDAEAEPLEMTSGPVWRCEREQALLRYGRWAVAALPGSPGHW